MSASSELPPATEPVPPKPHPVDIALAALSEVAAEMLASGRPARFAELQTVTTIAMQVQRFRPMAGVEDALNGNGNDEFEAVGIQPFGPAHHLPNPIRRGVAPRFNDGADLNREIVMLAQSFLTQYMEAEKKRASKPDPDVRLNEVGELAELFELRLKLSLADQPVPGEITYRIDHLLKRIGEPHHELEPGPVVSALDVW